MTPTRSTSGGLLGLCLAPLLYSALSVSAKLAGGHLSVWHIGVGRFGLGLLVVPIIVKALGLGLWGQKRFLLSVGMRQEFRIFLKSMMTI